MKHKRQRPTMTVDVCILVGIWLALLAVIFLFFSVQGCGSSSEGASCIEAGTYSYSYTITETDCSDEAVACFDNYHPPKGSFKERINRQCEDTEVQDFPAIPLWWDEKPCPGNEPPEGKYLRLSCNVYSCGLFARSGKRCFIYFDYQVVKRR